MVGEECCTEKFLFVSHISANPIKNINEKSFGPRLRLTKFSPLLLQPPPPRRHGPMNHQIRRNFGVVDYKLKKMKKFQFQEKIMTNHPK